MLMKRRDGSASPARLQGIAAGLASGVLDRRTFLRRSGLAAGAGAALGLMPLGSVRKAQAGPKIVGAPTEIKKNICTHCSVGCTVIAEVQNGVWVGQEPAWDSPINRGSHCAKGASVRELVHGDRRLKYPMKLVNGEWQRLSWEQAINEIGDKMLEIRAKSGADHGPDHQRAARLAAEQADHLKHGIHLIVVQSADGSLVVGDSHHYASAPDPFSHEQVDALILDEFRSALGIEPPPTIERWIGTYASAADRSVLIDAPEPSVRLAIVTCGAGASTGFAIGEELIASLLDTGVTA